MLKNVHFSMSFKDLLIVWGNLAFGGTFSVHGSFQGYMERGFSSWRCFDTAKHKAFTGLPCLWDDIYSPQKMRVSLGTLNVIMDVFA